MTLETLYFIAQIISAAAIVGSLIFVGLQLRATRRQQLLALSDERQANLSRLNEIVIGDPEVREILLKGRSSLADLSPSEFLAFTCFQREVVGMLLRFRAHRHYAIVEDEHWQSITTVMRQWFEEPGNREWWEATREDFAEPSRAFIDSLISRSESPETGMSHDA